MASQHDNQYEAMKAIVDRINENTRLGVWTGEIHH